MVEQSDSTGDRSPSNDSNDSHSPPADRSANHLTHPEAVEDPNLVIGTLAMEDDKLT